MGYESKVQVDEQGIVRRESLVGLTSGDWGAWVKDQIHEKQRVFFIRDRGDYSTTSIFTDLIPDLEASGRFKAYEGIAQCLDRAYEDRKPGTESADWNDIQLDDLLSLVGGVETKFEGHDCTHQDTYFAERANAIARFLDVVEPRPCFEFSETERDLYFRTLQALCGTEAKLPYEFWAKHLEKSPSAYGFVCFSGASNNSPYDGINLLSYVDWSNEDARQRMNGSLLSFYYDHHGDSKVIEAIEKKKLELPKETHKVFTEAKEEAAELVEKDREGKF